MTYKLIFNGSKPFSINGAYYKKTFTKTTACREWENGIINKLSLPGNREIIKRLKEFCEGKNLRFGVFIQYFIDDNIYYTKDGRISIRSKDLSNVEKLLIDVIFGNKSVGLNINDTNIDELLSKKGPYKGWKIVVNIKTLPIKGIT